MEEFKLENTNKNQLATKEKNTRFGLIDPFLEDFFNLPLGRKEFRGIQNIMNTDIKENAKSYILEIDMPGFAKKDITLSFDDGYLTISAKQDCSEKDENKHNYLRRERCVGSCKRSFYIGEVDASEINAKLENGILNITIPKSKIKPETTTIEIK